MLIDSEKLKAWLIEEALKLPKTTALPDSTNFALGMVLGKIAELEQKHKKKINEIEEYLGKSKT